MESSDPQVPRDLGKHLEGFSEELENRSKLTPSTEGFIKSVRNKISKNGADLTRKKIKKPDHDNGRKII